MGLKDWKICACTSYHNEYNIVHTKVLRQNTFYKENGHSYQDRFHRSFPRSHCFTMRATLRGQFGWICWNFRKNSIYINLRKSQKRLIISYHHCFFIIFLQTSLCRSNQIPAARQSLCVDQIRFRRRGNLCVEKIGSRPPSNLCVDKIGSRHHGNLCVDKIGFLVVQAA